MIFVTLGTHGQPFSRALRLVAGLAATDDVLVQHGATPPDVSLPGLRWVEHLDWPELTTQLRAAEVVICHAGVGSTICSLREGKKPILIPRLAAHGEHVDDHQLQLADRLEQADWVLVCRDGVAIEPLVDRARHARAGVVAAGDGRLGRAVAQAARAPRNRVR